jgi:N-acetylglucosamine kinase-like BadF-type ATPase
VGLVTDAGYVVAVDGGGSKTDVVLAATDGTVVGRVSGPGSSQHALGAAAATTVIDGLVSGLLEQHGVPATAVVTAHCYLSAVDLPHEVEDLAARLEQCTWARALVVDNDVFALLRTGTDAADAAAVVVGTGTNAAAVRADGERARYLALGRVSGDWGGGSGLAEAAVWAAARHADGRGPSTVLHDSVLARTGMASVEEVSIGLHDGTLDCTGLADLARDVLAAAAVGDDVAVSLRTRQADEVAVMARAALARLDLAHAPVPVVLGGGILRARDPGLDADVAAAFERELPSAEPVVAGSPSVLGALLLALGNDEGAVGRAIETYP